ncbi:unnamed protein product [Ambrosiozyma monospora]|uniref:Unnamed protein product n=1 Tax=Ambrosiozyma monospora TaxID=43982 RepID=A0A9W6YT76_AMBMO|nr:unnamed protein product [Ambrosiozyma monospora]
MRGSFGADIAIGHDSTDRHLRPMVLDTFGIPSETGVNLKFDTGCNNFDQQGGQDQGNILLDFSDPSAELMRFMERRQQRHQLASSI